MKLISKIEPRPQLDAQTQHFQTHRIVIQIADTAACI